MCYSTLMLIVIIIIQICFTSSVLINMTKADFVYSRERRSLEPNPRITVPDEQRLLRDLLIGYDKDVRPVIKRTDKVLVDFSLKVIQIVNINEKMQQVTTNVWTTQKWNNPFLVWDPAEYGGIDVINLEPTNVWVPVIILYNSAEKAFTGGLEKYKTKIIIKSNGDHTWFSTASFKSSCDITVKYFPFDKQKCKLRFGSWTYSGDMLDINTPYDEGDLTDYMPSGEWDLLAMPAKKNLLYYRCCPIPFPDVTYTLIIKRKSLYYLFNLILPCTLIATLILLGFCLPPESGERIALGITVLLAMTVFLNMAATRLPTTSQDVPLLARYYLLVMMEIALSIFASTMTLNVYHRQNAMAYLPRYLRVYALVFISKIVSVICKFKDYFDWQSEKNLKSRKSELKEMTQPILAHSPISEDEVALEAVNIQSPDIERRLPRIIKDRKLFYPIKRLPQDICQPTSIRKKQRACPAEDDINVLINNVKKQKEKQDQANKRQYVALILDRFFLIVFLLTMVISTMVMFLEASESE